MPTAADLQAEARSWIDTPLYHRGRTRAGIDCLGLIIAAGVGAGVLDPPDEEHWPYARYGRLPNPVWLRASLDHFLVPIAGQDKRPADVISLSWGAHGQPAHLAILAERKGRVMMIHGDPLVRPPRVLETGYAGDWVERTCEGAWRYPGLV